MFAVFDTFIAFVNFHSFHALSIANLSKTSPYPLRDFPIFRHSNNIHMVPQELDETAEAIGKVMLGGVETLSRIL